MKGKLEFDLNDPDDRYKFEVCNRAEDFQSCFFDIYELFRRELKYGNHSEETSKYLEDIRQQLFNLMESRNLTHLIMP